MLKFNEVNEKNMENNNYFQPRDVEARLGLNHNDGQMCLENRHGDTFRGKLNESKVYDNTTSRASCTCKLCRKVITKMIKIS